MGRGRRIGMCRVRVVCIRGIRKDAPSSMFHVFVKSQPEKLACCFIWAVVSPVQGAAACLCR